MIERFKEILRGNGFTGKDFAGLIKGLSYGSYRAMTRKGASVVPKWVQSFVIGYELGKSEKSTADGSNDDEV